MRGGGGAVNSNTKVTKTHEKIMFCAWPGYGPGGLLLFALAMN